MGFSQLFLALAIIALSEGTNYPSNLACTAVNSTVLQITWDQATDATVVGYHLDVERVDGLKIEFGLPSIDLNHISYETYTFYGLGKYAVYNVTIHAYFNSGANGTDYVVSCQTSSDTPDASNFNFSCDGISTSEITCNWDALSTVYWNGIPQGYQLQYIGFVNDYYTEINLTTSDLTYTVSGLSFDSWYILQLRTVSDAGLSPFTSDHAKTWGWPVTVENKTRYYCYETIPDRMEWEWEEMPCTVYVGIILAFMLLTFIFMMCSCLLCCCKGKTESKSDIAVNIFNEQRDDDERELYDDDDDDDDYDDEPDEDYSDEADDIDYDTEGNPTEAALVAKKKRKRAGANKEGNGMDDTGEEESDEEVETEEEPEYETSEVETEPYEEYESSEGDEDLDEEERAVKKEKKLAAIATAKALREKKREDKAQRKAEKDAERAKLKAEKDAEKAKLKAEKDAEKAKLKAEKNAERAKLKAEKEKERANQKETVLAEKAKRKAAREHKAKHKTEQNQKQKAEMKKKKEEEKREKKDEKCDHTASDSDSEDYYSEEYSDTDEKDSSNDSRSEDKSKIPKNNSRKQPFVGKAALSVVNEKRNDKTNKTRAKNKTTDNSKESKTGKQKENITQNVNKKEKNSRKRNVDSNDSCNESDIEYYEDWDPNAENKPGTNVIKVKVNYESETLEDEKKSNITRKKIKQTKVKDKHNDAIDVRAKSKNRKPISNQADKNKDTDRSPSQDDSEESDGYDSDDEDCESDDSDGHEYSAEESYGEIPKAKGRLNTKTKIFNKTKDMNVAYNSSEDSGRGSAMSCNWGVENNYQTKDIKKTGFFGSLFGQTATTKTSSNKLEKTKTTDLKYVDKSKTKKSGGLNESDSNNEYISGSTIHTSARNLNYDRNKNNNMYSSNLESNNGNSKSNSSKSSSKVTTDFGDWGSDDDYTSANNTKYNNYSSSGYDFNPTTKNIAVSRIKTIPGNNYMTGEDMRWSNNSTNRNGQLHATNNELNLHEQHDAMGMYSNSNVQKNASKENGKFSEQTKANYHNGGLFNNNAPDLKGQFVVDDHDWNQNAHFSTTYNNIPQDGQFSSVSNASNQETQFAFRSNDSNRNARFDATNRSSKQNVPFNSINDLSVHKRNIGATSNGQNYGQNGGLHTEQGTRARQKLNSIDIQDGVGGFQTESQSNSHKHEPAIHGIQANGINNPYDIATDERNALVDGLHKTEYRDKPRKLVTFRTNAASSLTSAGYNHENLPAKAVQQGMNSGGSVTTSRGNGAGSSEPNRNQFITMPEADIVLPDSEINKHPRSPVGKFVVNKPAWGKTKSDTSNPEKRKGSKTPVEELLKRHQRMSLTEPEPVFQHDRLAKKFPFLNADATGRENENVEISGDANPSAIRKNQSDSNLPSMFFGKGKSLKTSSSTNDIQSIPTMQANKNEKGSAALNQENRDKVFYGFGVGKWRLAAAKWLNTWKMKRRPVKTAKSSWE